MTLVIEDGTGKLDGQSYASVDDLRAYAKLRGATLPTQDSACEILLMKAMDYLEGLNYQGERFRPDQQPLSWPRVDVEIEGWPLPYNDIPRQLIYAQCALAIEAQTTELLPTRDINDPSGAVTSQTVGPVTTVYTNAGVVRRVPAVAKADVMLRLLLRRQGLIAIRT
jgi:hypothetical protein